MGAANSNITEHVVAGILLQSHKTPAKIAPIMPPTSKRVERSADVFGPYDAKIQLQFKNNFMII